MNYNTLKVHPNSLRNSQLKLTIILLNLQHTLTTCCYCSNTTRSKANLHVPYLSVYVYSHVCTLQAYIMVNTYYSCKCYVRYRKVVSHSGEIAIIWYFSKQHSLHCQAC